MKNSILLISLLIWIGVQAQEAEEFKTIFGGRDIGGYGAVALGFSPINQDNAMIFSARGGVVMGHAVGLGIGGSGFFTEYQYNPSLQQKASLAGGYGGAFVEFIILGRSPVHVSIPLLIGIGGAAYTTWDNEGSNDFERENSIEQTATFGVFEPGVELEFNFTRFFRVAAYFNYRYASNIDITKIIDGQPVQLVSPDALNSYSAGLIFKFGKF